MGRVNRKVIKHELEKIQGQRGIGSAEQVPALLALSLQVQLEILDVLDDILQSVSGVSVRRSDDE